MKQLNACGKIVATALMAFAFTAGAWAADAKAKDAKDKDAAAAAEDAPAVDEATLAKNRKKALSQKKPMYRNKLADAKKVAELGQFPILVAVLPKTNSPVIQEIEKKVLMRKEFLQDFAKQNLVLVLLSVKPDSKDPKKIDLKGFKEPEVKFLENFAVTDSMISRAKQANKDEPKFTDMACYPFVVCVSPDMTKSLFRLPSYDREGGFGVWMSQMKDFLEGAEAKLVISPQVQKIIDNPDEPKKWK